MLLPVAVAASAGVGAGCRLTFEEARLVAHAPPPSGVVAASSSASSAPRDDRRCRALADEQRSDDARAAAFSYLGGGSGLGALGAGAKDMGKGVTLALSGAAVLFTSLFVLHHQLAQSAGVQWAKECS